MPILEPGRQKHHSGGDGGGWPTMTSNAGLHQGDDDGNHTTTPVGESEPPRPKRRKIRKGTQSCWECKRRKVRCTYAKPADSICDGCRSRRTKCTSQEFEDDGGVDTSPAPGPFVRQSTVVNIPNQQRRRSATEKEESGRPKRRLEGEMAAARSCSAHLLLLSAVTDGHHDVISRVLLEVWPSDEELSLILSMPVHVSTLYHGIVCKPYSRFFSTGVYEQPRDLLRLPPTGSHPVFIARKLLLLASWLQGISQGRSTNGSHRGEDYYDYASRLVGTASRFVTSNDELVNSIEGIECLMIESMYLNNGGHLRRAWFTNRKAMVIAQMLGLHQGISSTAAAAAAAYLDETASRPRIDPDYMWLRLVLSDRYLSLMLGLPQGSLENVFATPEALSTCGGVERLERIMGVAAGLILQRNSLERLDLAHTQKIDKLLQEAADCMPPPWWAADSLRCCGIADDAGGEFQGSLRLVNQIAYHHLLIQLHLPYMLQQPSSPAMAGAYDYSKLTAAMASRAILAQYVAFRAASETSAAYCRGIDFITFTASMTLCLAHIECRRRGHDDAAYGHISAGSSSSAFHALRHQRLSDRGLMERTLQVVDGMATRSGEEDVVARKISELLRPLLEIEDDSASGEGYHVSASSSSSSSSSTSDAVVAAAATTTAPDSQWTSERTRGATTPGVLSVQILYCGTIKIAHSPADDAQNPSSNPGGLVLLHSGDKNHLPEHAARGRPVVVVACCDSPLQQQPTTTAQLDQQFDPTQTVLGTHHAGYEISATPPANADWQAVPSFIDQLSPLPPRPIPAAAAPTSSEITGEEDDTITKTTTGPSTVDDGAEDAHLLVPGLETELGDWVLQGVDAAFFDSLITQS